VFLENIESGNDNRQASKGRVTYLPRLPKGRNLISVKEQNLAIVLEIIRKVGPVSRADISDISGLTPSTVTNLIKDLIDRGIVRESGMARSTGGRKPILISLNRDYCQVVGIDISRSRMKAVLTNLGGEIAFSDVRSCKASEGVDSIIHKVLDLISDCIRAISDRESNLVGVGIGCPGWVNPEQGTVIHSPNFEGWHNVKLKERVEKEIGMPVFIDNDANCSALAESWFGIGRGVGNLIFLSIDSGIGGGIILNEEIYHGANCFAGEVGHMTINIDGSCCQRGRCDCGNVGCFELLASIPAVFAQVQERKQDFPDSKLAKIGDCLTIEEFFRLAGYDPLGRVISNDLSEIISGGIVNLIRLYDPEIIVLGGRLIEAAEDSFIQRIRQLTEQKAFFARSGYHVNLVRTSLPSNAKAIGAATLVIEHCFRHPAEMQSNQALASGQGY